MNKLLLIDGNAVLHRAYHALPPLTTIKGEPINAVYGLVSMLLRLIQNVKPTHIAVAIDRPEPTFRHQIFENYQIQRPEADESLIGQFSKAHAFVEACHIPLLSKAGFEADDVLGTLANTFKTDPSIDEVIIVTGDRDILQLVEGKVKVFMPTKGVNEGQMYESPEVISRMGVPPDQIVDYKALVGDPSDNYPGVAGIGPKTATTLLSKYNSLDNIYNHLTDLPDSLKNKLELGRENAYLSQKLAQIVKDVDIDTNLENFGNWKIDSPETLNLFQEFGFKTLTERVIKLGKEIDASHQMTLL